MATIDRAQVEHVAKLASLSLPSDEAERLTAEIGAILGYVEELATVDTTGVPPFSHATAATALREDAVQPGLSRDEALAGAPRAADDGFAVKAFVEGG